MLEFALVRSPGVEFEKGITTAGMGLPDMEKARRQHGAYVKALKFCGLDVKVMEPLRGYPDACFVEDTAVVVGKEVVICRPGAEERRGEEETVADNLKKLFQKIRRIESPGTVDGGDILVMRDRMWIGLTERTNRPGAEQLKGIAQEKGFVVHQVDVPFGLHLKTFVGRCGENRVMIDKRLAAEPSFQDVERYVVKPAEAYGANCRDINGRLVMPAGFPNLATQAEKWGLEPVEVEMSEFRKMDGGVSCLSIVW